MRLNLAGNADSGGWEMVQSKSWEKWEGSIFKLHVGSENGGGMDLPFHLTPSQKQQKGCDHGGQSQGDARLSFEKTMTQESNTPCFTRRQQVMKTTKESFWRGKDV